jgi:hypothetical protein
MNCEKCHRPISPALKKTISPLGTRLVILSECPKCNYIKINGFQKFAEPEPSRDIKLGKSGEGEAFKYKNRRRIKSCFST